MHPETLTTKGCSMVHTHPNCRTTARRTALVVRRLTASCLILVAAGTAACSMSHSRAGASSSAAPTASVPASAPTPAVSRTSPPLSSEAADAVAALSPQERALRETSLATPAPQRPAEADQHTVNGAVAAAEYFIALRPYVYATADLTAWQAMSDDSCAYCDTVSYGATTLHSTGGWIDPWEQQIGFSSLRTETNDPNFYTAAFDVTSGEYLIHSMGQKPTAIGTAQESLLVFLHWEDGAGWRINDVTTL